jgi:hypothetical protein
MKAHTKMENISCYNWPRFLITDVKECVKTITIDNKIAIDVKFVPRRFESIKKAADDGQKLSK